MNKLQFHFLLICGALIAHIEYSMCSPAIAENAQTPDSTTPTVESPVNERAKAILAQAAKVYANARTFSCLVYENKNRDGRIARARYEVQWRRPNLAAVKRFETDLATQRTNLRRTVIDGKTIHQLADNEYSKRELPPLRGFGVLLPTGVFSLSLLGSSGFVEILGTPQVPQVKYLGAGRVGDVAVERVEVKVVNDELNVVYSFSIDKKQFLLRQASMRLDAGIGVMTTTETYANIRVNAPIDAHVFRFAPTPQPKAR